MSKQSSTTFKIFTSFNPSISFRHSRSSQSPSSVQKIDHPKRFRHSDIPNLPPSQKLRSPSIRAPVTDHPNLHRQLHNSIIFHVYNVYCPSAQAIMNSCGFLSKQFQQFSNIDHYRYNVQNVHISPTIIGIQSNSSVRKK